MTSRIFGLYIVYERFSMRVYHNSEYKIYASYQHRSSFPMGCAVWSVGAVVYGFAQKCVIIALFKCE